VDLGLACVPAYLHDLILHGLVVASTLYMEVNHRQAFLKRILENIHSVRDSANLDNVIKHSFARPASWVKSWRAVDVRVEV